VAGELSRQEMAAREGADLTADATSGAALRGALQRRTIRRSGGNALLEASGR
jgi:hypothetical protein